MMGLFVTNKRREAEQDPPSRADFPDEHSFLTCHLIWQCGGRDRLTPDRLEIAALCVGLMIDMRTSRAVDLVRHADVLERLLSRLPLSRTVTVPEVVTDNMSLADMSRLYGRLCGDASLDVFDDVADVTPSAPVPIAPTPQKPTDAPAPEPPVSSVAPAPESPTDAPLSQDLPPIPPDPPPADRPPARQTVVRGGFDYDGANSTGFTSMGALVRDRWGGGR
jgi:hypothetical protein